MKTFSIITPVYNGEKYISKCIEAIANSNYDLSKVEHIIIDDGSTDRTKAICQEYALKYKHIKFFSKKNGNWGSVINYVKNNHLATNDLIAVCDADDILLSKAFQVVNDKILDSDLFVSGFYRWNGKRRKIKINPYFYLFKRHLVKKSKWHYHTALIVPQSAWLKKEVFYQIPNLKEGIAYQDTILFTYAFLLSQNIRFTNKPTSLYWCVRPGNSMDNKKEIKGLSKLVSNFNLYEEKKWINPFVFYTLGSKSIRKYIKSLGRKYDFAGAKPNFSGFPFYVRPILWLLYFILVKKFIKK